MNWKHECWQTVDVLNVSCLRVICWKISLLYIIFHSFQRLQILSFFREKETLKNCLQHSSSTKSSSVNDMKQPDGSKTDAILLKWVSSLKKYSNQTASAQKDIPFFCFTSIYDCNYLILAQMEYTILIWVPSAASVPPVCMRANILN